MVVIASVINLIYIVFRSSLFELPRGYMRRILLGYISQRYRLGTTTFMIRALEVAIFGVGWVIWSKWVIF